MSYAGLFLAFGSQILIWFLLSYDSATYNRLIDAVETFESHVPDSNQRRLPKTKMKRVAEACIARRMLVTYRAYGQMRICVMALSFVVAAISGGNVLAMVVLESAQFWLVLVTAIALAVVVTRYMTDARYIAKYCRQGLGA